LGTGQNSTREKKKKLVAKKKKKKKKDPGEVKIPLQENRWSAQNCTPSTTVAALERKPTATKPDKGGFSLGLWE